MLDHPENPPTAFMDKEKRDRFVAKQKDAIHKMFASECACEPFNRHDKMAQWPKSCGPLCVNFYSPERKPSAAMIEGRRWGRSPNYVPIESPARGAPEMPDRVVDNLDSEAFARKMRPSLALTEATPRVECPSCGEAPDGPAQATKGPGPEGRSCGTCGAVWATVHCSETIGYVPAAISFSGT